MDQRASRSTGPIAGSTLAASVGGPACVPVWLYTDGSCLDNQRAHQGPQPAGWGVAIVVPSAQGPLGRLVAELFGPVPVDAAHPLSLGALCGTNNTGELTAICEALEWLA
eukprot:12924486-Alexandrium_andersonii.AAC.1